MEPMSFFLMSMQAAGLVMSFKSANDQDKLIKLGRELEQNQFATNLEALRLQNAEGSLDEMKQLRQNIGSQIATQAARGNRGGSSYSGISKASNTFDNDERKRRMNLLANESELRANHILSGMHSLQSETQLGQSLTSTVLNSLPTTSMFGTSKSSSSSSEKKWVNPDNFSWGY